VINTVALGFLIFLPAAECLSSKLQDARCIAGLPKEDRPHSLHNYSTDPHQIWGEYSQIVSNEHYCFQFPIFPSTEDQ